MKYISTRGTGAAVTAAQALLDGAAGDGGLYLPESLPDLSSLMAGEYSYVQLASSVFKAYFPDFEALEMDRVAGAAYAAQFDAADVTPLVRVGDSHVLELHRGPTAAFKDIALQALPSFLKLAKDALTPETDYLVLTATSGDTGSAAMRGFSGMPGFHVLVYYPKDGVSAVQWRQMTAMPGDNVMAVGISGNFDDAQAGVKAAFQKAPKLLPMGLKLTSANSINIGRLVPQVVYYIKALRDLKAKGVLKPGLTADFIVPSGNFGDILAGYLAKRMGLPIGKLVCASNSNRVLHDFMKTGVYDSKRPLFKTFSPSMDILVSSNLERLLYYAAEGDAGAVKRMMSSLKEAGNYRADEAMMGHIRSHFDSSYATDRECLDAINKVWQEHRYLMDPHTAAGWLAQRALFGRENPRVVLSTASPFKFPDAMLMALALPAKGGVMEQVKALSDITGQPLPVSIKDALELPVRQDYQIPKKALVADVIRRALQW